MNSHQRCDTVDDRQRSAAHVERFDRSLCRSSEQQARTGWLRDVRTPGSIEQAGLTKRHARQVGFYVNPDGAGYAVAAP
jgi:ribosomal protein L13E